MTPGWDRMAAIAFRGAVWIGGLSATWPFATLTVAKDRLTLASTKTRWAIWDWGRYDFSPSQVVSIKRFGFLPIIAWGIRVNHNRWDIPRRVVFWTLGSREEIITSISTAGFIAVGQEK